MPESEMPSRPDAPPAADAPLHDDAAAAPLHDDAAAAPLHDGAAVAPPHDADAAPSHDAVAALTRVPEPALLPDLLAQARLAPAQAAAAQALALRLADGVRRRARAGGREGLVQGLLQEFALDSQEGVALMCLAEALLRVPDAATRDALIRDKLAHGDWHAHLGRSPSLFVNAAAWGLLLTGSLVATHGERGLSATLKRVLARGGEPLVRKGVDLAMRTMGEQFVTGQTIEEALRRSRGRQAQGFRHSYDMLGEAALTRDDAERYLAAYEHAIDAIGAAAAGRGPVHGPGISIKLSALHPRYARAQVGRVDAELVPRLAHLVRRARRVDIGLNVDAEESERLALSLALLQGLCADDRLAGWDGLGVVIQAYQKRCPAVVDRLVALARASRRRLMVRLVKGAYWDSEIKRAQLDGLDGYPVYTRKAHTDVAYLACARRLLAAPDAVFAQFATHNAHTLAAVHTLAGPDPHGQRLEFQCLHGMGEPLYEQLVGPAAGAERRPCRIYAPVGTHETLLAYLVRRLLENGANSSFVHRIADDAVPLSALVEDPVQVVEANAAREGAVGLPHPAIALPHDLYRARGGNGADRPAGPSSHGGAGEPGAGAGRVNSSGLDLADEATLAALGQALADDQRHPHRAGPMVVAAAGADAVPGRAGAADVGARREAAAGSDARDAASAAADRADAPAHGAAAAAVGAAAAERAVVNPADAADRVGQVRDAGADDVEGALAAAARAAPDWAATPPAVRAACLDAAADRLDADRLSWLPLLVREAGKTAANALGEVREAVDFLRYCAAELRADADAARQPPLGVVVCISPWNFPLAIFTGQVAAALAAGNAVLAKPAEQTPLVAARMVALLHAAGVAPAALQLLPGPGETVGAALTADARVGGVLFTGSTAVARLLQRATARLAPHGRPVVLVAETGGQNAMVVDSSALAEQAVADIVASAFDSAGQRCSALRVLCVQDDGADRLLAMLRGAMAELHVGDPRRLATDVGPVIDDEAHSALVRHVRRMRGLGRSVWQPPAGGAAHAAGAGSTFAGAPGTAEASATAPEDGAAAPRGHFFAPTLIDIEGLHDLGDEVFGPVLHVWRYRRERLPEVLAAIAATGYGLTQGVHTRLDETVAQVLAASRAGNVYVNRNLVGAVVGVQPFGGDGLSGTGPKAGGPLYRLRLLAACAPGTARAAVGRAGTPVAAAAGRGRDAPGDGDAGRDDTPAATALQAWAVARGDGALADACARALRDSPCLGWIELAGPTGESNRYATQPREAVLGLVDDHPGADDDRLAQLAAVLALGGRMVWPPTARALAERLPAAVRACIRLAADPWDATVALDAVVHHGAASSWTETLRRLAERPGPIVGLVALRPGERDLPPERLVVERSLSVNTAAAGGNASLMTLRD